MFHKLVGLTSKKIFFCGLLLSWMSPVYAFTCFKNSDLVNGFKGGNEDVYVPLDTELVTNSGTGQIVNEYADVSAYFSCQNDIPEFFTDYFFLRSFQPAISPNASFGVQVRGVNYFDPSTITATSTDGVIIQEFPRYQTNMEPLQLKLIMKVNNRPGNGIFIKKNDLLITLDLFKFADKFDEDIPVYRHNPQSFTWRFFADNDLVLTEGTCDINDGQLIVVDLGTIHRSRIAPPGGGLSSDGRQNVQLTYQCKNDDGSIDTDYSAPIRLYLSSVPTSFSPGAVLTRQGWNAGSGAIFEGLGIEFYHADTGRLLVPNDNTNGYFTSSIQNGRGGPDVITVAPVKEAGANLDEGEFNAVATIVMTLD